jgi:hypothetical protein
LCARIVSGATLIDHIQSSRVAAGFDRALALFEAISLVALASPALLPGPGQP